MSNGTLRQRLERLERQDGTTPERVRFRISVPGDPDYGRTHDDAGRPIPHFTIRFDNASMAPELSDDEEGWTRA